MSSHSRHSVTDVTLPHLFRPAEIAKALGCSEWWVKEQARRRRIPFTRVGGAYRFTAEHFAEIVCAFEERPPEHHAPAPDVGAAASSRQARPTRRTSTEVRLQAKRPRRAVRRDRALAAA
ncbi:helix-turn-helix domain-containing protein [Streptomyces sp. NPDC001262]|uniref:helix-turn-helix domain-containing protein n=1 Tax=Streptomyces sp. NPDC001262 TaxID=3364552 RepID=UPI0036B34700